MLPKREHFREPRPSLKTATVASKSQINPKKIVGQDMKRRINRPGEALALILASTLCVSTPCLAAQSSDSARQQEQPQQSQQQPAAQQQAQPQAQQPGQPQDQQANPTNQTFAGKIIKLTTGKYALLT